MDIINSNTSPFPLQNNNYNPFNSPFTLPNQSQNISDQPATGGMFASQVINQNSQGIVPKTSDGLLEEIGKIPEEVKSALVRKQSMYTHPKMPWMIWIGSNWYNIALGILRADPQALGIVVAILMPSAKPAPIPYFPLAKNPTGENFIHFSSIVDEIDSGSITEELDEIISRTIDAPDGSTLRLDKLINKHEKYFGYQIGPDKFNPRMSHWLGLIKTGTSTENQYYDHIFTNIRNEISNNPTTYYERACDLAKVLTKSRFTRGVMASIKILISHCCAMIRDRGSPQLSGDTNPYFFSINDQPKLNEDLSSYMMRVGRSGLGGNTNTSQPVNANAASDRQRRSAMIGSLNDISIKIKTHCKQKSSQREKVLKTWNPPGFAYSSTDNYTVMYINDDNVIIGDASLNNVLMPKKSNIDSLTIGGSRVLFEVDDDNDPERWCKNPGWRYEVKF